ncbi:MAG: DUF2283 domain-containing protein [Desulfurococcaceae archaeon]
MPELKHNIETKKYFVNPHKGINIEYDRQSDILYIHFDIDTEEADEEVLSEDGEVAFRIRKGEVVSIMILNFSNKIGGYII